MPNLGRWYDKSLPRIAGFNFVSQMVFLALKHLRKVIQYPELESSLRFDRFDKFEYNVHAV